MPSLETAVAIVTGGTRGIGFAIAGALLDRGVRVVVNGRTPASCERAQAGLARTPDRADRLAAVPADVADPAQAEGLVRTAVERFGGLDILVNNAGIGIFRDVAAMSVEEWRRVLDTNLSGVFYCCRAAIPHLRRRGGGWIINISSLAARNAVSGGAAYCASKAGLTMFSEVLMQEVRYDDIRVSVIMPGSVETEFAGREAGSGSGWKLAPADVARVVIDLLGHDPRSLPSRVEIRPSKPRR